MGGVPRVIEDAARELQRRLRERLGEALLEMRLFGSHARGEGHGESDVDLLVVLKSAGWQARREVLDVASDVGLEHGVLLSPTVIDREILEHWRRQGRPIWTSIEREGVRL